MNCESKTQEYLYELLNCEPSETSLVSVHKVYTQAVNELVGLGVFNDSKKVEFVHSDFIRFKDYLVMKYSEDSECASFAFYDVEDRKRIKNMSPQEKYQEYLKNNGLD
ncbi:TPA: hypothetical protein N2907_001687 [Vibrio parahaemolyticus]|nr:hypothetical protein [Vibrio parahaemolyticus]HCH2585472.1 hypothetical protein [Vibrio parahaemolyticus]HCM1319408.1 hypothetical protein [Vibrio parahaemolyticus]